MCAGRMSSSFLWRPIFIGCTDFLGLRLIVHGVPLLGLVGGHDPLALPELLRLAVRHDGCWRRMNGCRGGCWRFG